MDDSSNQRGVTSVFRRIRVLLIAILGTVAVLVLVSQMGLQWQVSGHEQDIQTIALATRQATLSQQIAKAGNRLLVVTSGDGRKAVEEELRTALATFRQTHAGLQHGDVGLHLPGGNSLAIIRLFSTLESDFQGIVYAADQVLAHADHPGEFHQAVQKLNESETGFLPRMEAIVAQYKLEAQQRESTHRWFALVVAVAALGGMFVVARFVLLPLLAGLQKNLLQIEQTGKELDKLFMSNPIAQLIVDPASFAVVRANGRASILFGNDTEELNEKPLVSLFDSRLEANRSFLARLRGGEVFDGHEVLLVDAQQHAIAAFGSVRPVAFGNQRRYLVSLADKLGND